MIRNQKIKGTFICGPLFFKWIGVFQSWLDCFSIGVWAFIYSKHKLFHLQKSFYASVHLLQFLNALTYGSITLFFKCIKSDIVPILPSKHCICTGDYVFGRDYSNLNNVFQIYIFSNTYTRFIVENMGKIWCNKKGTLLVLHFIKISYLGFF